MKARRAAVTFKSPSELEMMRAAASTTAEILDCIADAAVPGTTTWELDRLAESECERRGVTPAFRGLYGFPACLCVAVNDVVVHGIPSKETMLKDGDIIGLDFGVVHRGWYGDCARTVPVGGVDSESERLMETARAALGAAIAACVPGARLRDIGRAVEESVHREGFAVVRDFVGHGIGRRLHEEPGVPNYYDRSALLRLRPGMVLCVEPMINAGSSEVSLRADQWTAVTVDGRRSAHFEHTIAITDQGPEVLSVPGQGLERAFSSPTP